MKKLFIVLLMAPAMVFMAGPAFADLKFKFDFDGNGSWGDIDYDLMQADTVTVDVWATDLSSLTSEFLALDWRLIVDVTKASVSNLVPNPDLSVHAYYDAGGGNYEIQNYFSACPSGAPDNLLLLTFDLQATASGDHNLIAQNDSNASLDLVDCDGVHHAGVDGIATIHQESSSCSDGTSCDDGLFCTIDDTCSDGSCVGEPKGCDDGLFCTGQESCDEEKDMCVSSGNPCTTGQPCNEDTNSCNPTVNEDENDGKDDDSDDSDSGAPSLATTTILKAAKRTYSSININDPGNIDPTKIPKTTKPEIRDTGKTALGTTPGTITIPDTPDTPATPDKAKPTEKTATSPAPITKLTSKTTTAPQSSPSRVLVTPSWSMIDSGGKLQFSAKTILDGEEVEGSYQWDIVPAATAGSSIDKNGLLTAMSNNSGSNNVETVRIADIIHENIYTTASVVIKTEKLSSNKCELSVSPSSATVLPGGTISFFASNSGSTCAKGSYKWEISSKISSHINSEGIYTADKNVIGNSVIDIITAEDTANGIKTSALVNILFEEKTVQSALNSAQKTQQETSSVTERKGYSTTFIISALVIVFLIVIILFRSIKK